MKNIMSILKTALFVLFITMLFLYWADSDFDFLKENLSGDPHQMHHMHSLHNASIIILTFIIACVAWIQLGGIAKNGAGDFLLRIDERLGNKSIIKARMIIHKIYMKSKIKNPDFEEGEHCEWMANEIYWLGEKKDKHSVEEYVYLLNFLDFLETISVFTNNGYIDIKEIDDLMNQSLVFFWKIFSRRIEERRRKYTDSTFYYQFEKLYLTIKTKKELCFCCCYCCLKSHCIFKSVVRFARFKFAAFLCLPRD